VWIALLRAVDAVELVEMVPEDREPDVLASRDAELAQLLGRDEQLALLAIVEISDDVQSLHSDTPFQAKIRSKGLRYATPGDPLRCGAPLDPGRRAKSFLQRFTQAKNIAVKSAQV
jgi:hypothetical protein